MIQIIWKTCNTVNNFVTLFNWNTWIFSWVENVVLFIEDGGVGLINQILVWHIQLHVFFVLSIYLVASKRVILPGIVCFIKLFMVFNIVLFIDLSIMWLIRRWNKWVNCCGSSLWACSSWTSCCTSHCFPSC